MAPILEITNRCIHCDNCRLVCPESAIMTDGENYQIDTWACTLCHICVEICPIDCIKTIQGG